VNVTVINESSIVLPKPVVFTSLTGSDLVLSWESETELNYSVLRSTSTLYPVDFSIVSGPTQGMSSYQEPVPVSGERHIYKVQVEEAD